MTWEIKALAHWLTEAGCEMAAMESTGPYWMPLYNLFELLGLDAMIVNAAHMKAVPGRKTDVKDAKLSIRPSSHKLHFRTGRVSGSAADAGPGGDLGLKKRLEALRLQPF